jgi:hypothetical protein
MTIGEAANSALTFNLRYLGQAVANLKVSDTKVNLFTPAKSAKDKNNKYAENNEKHFNCKIKMKREGNSWISSQAERFRKHFSLFPPRNNSGGHGNEEHRIESMFLTELSKKEGKHKNCLLRNIQPIKIAEVARFQMLTPFKASDKKELSYAEKKPEKGGGIDILARARKGNSTKLCIMEVKDEYRQGESQRTVIKQALAYATFIRELLRSDCGNDWWRIFMPSESKSSIPDKLILYVVCIMPFCEDINRTDKSFSGKKLKIENDELDLHYIYFNEGKEIKSIETSLWEK